MRESWLSVYDFAWAGPDDEPALDSLGRCIEAAVKRIEDDGDPFDPERAFDPDQTEHLNYYLLAESVSALYQEDSIVITHDNHAIRGQAAVKYLGMLVRGDRCA